MSPFELTIETTVAQVPFSGGLGLSGLSATLSDLSAAWPAASEAVRLAIGENFAAEASAVGPWAALNLAYARWKAKHFPGRKILERTGALKSSWTEEGGEGRVQVETPLTLYITSRVPYGRFHQQRTSKMPSRPFIVLSPFQKFRLGQAIHRAIGADVLKLPTPGARPSVRRALIGL